MTRLGAALFLTTLLGCRSGPAKVTADADAATDAGAGRPVLTKMALAPDAGPWVPNPFEATPVTHLAPVTLTVTGIVDLSDVGGGEETVGALVMGDQPYLLHCEDVVPVAAGFVKLEPVRLDVKDAIGCTRVFGARGSRLFAVAHHRARHRSDDDGTVVAVDLATQAQVWSAEVPPTDTETDAGVDANIVGGSAWLAGDRIVFLREGERVTSVVVALDAATGAVVWTRPKSGGLAVAGADIFTLDLDGTVHSLDPGTGAPRWSTRIEGIGRSSPNAVAIAAGGGVIALGANEQVFLVDAATGARRGVGKMPDVDGFGLPTRVFVFAAPGGNAEVYAFGNQLVRIDPKSGASLWSHPGFVRSVARGRDAIFTDRADTGEAALHAPDGLVHALDPATGHEVWSYGTSPRRPPAGRLALDLLEVKGSEILVTRLPQSDDVEMFQRGRDEVTPHTRTLEITLGEATDPQKVHLLVGDQPLSLGKDSRWSGPVHGRGTIWVRAVSGVGNHIVNPVSVDLESDAPTATAVLSVHKELHQACAGP